jgi:hypothetical protein
MPAIVLHLGHRSENCFPAAGTRRLRRQGVSARHGDEEEASPASIRQLGGNHHQPVAPVVRVVNDSPDTLSLSIPSAPCTPRVILARPRR